MKRDLFLCKERRRTETYIYEKRPTKEMYKRLFFRHLYAKRRRTETCIYKKRPKKELYQQRLLYISFFVCTKRGFYTCLFFYASVFRRLHMSFFSIHFFFFIHLCLGLVSYLQVSFLGLLSYTQVSIYTQVSSHKFCNQGTPTFDL